MSREKLVPKLRFEEYYENNEWIKESIGNLVSIGAGVSPIKFKDGNYLYVKVNDLNYSYRYQSDTEIRVALNKNVNLTNKYSVVFPKRGAAILTNKIRILKEDSYMDTNMMALIPEKINSNFLYSFISKTGLYKIADTSTIPQINNKHLEPYQIYLPDIYEQHKIGHFFKKIDEMIQLQQSKVNKIKDIKSAYLSEMFPKEGEKYPKKRFEGFIESWSLTKFSDIADVQRGLTYHPSNIVENGGVRVLRSSNIDEDTFITKDDDVFVNKDAININFAQKQDILITSANGSPRLVGKHAILEKLETRSVHGGFMLLARTDNQYFLNASMSSDWYRKFINYHVAGGGGSIGNIKKSDLENQLIYIPSKDEQRKIGSFFKNLDKQISIKEDKLAKLEKLKQAYLNDMFV